MRLPPRSLTWAGVLVAVAILVALIGWGERTPGALVAVLVAAAGAGLVVVLVIERPPAAVGAIFLLASISGVLIATPFGRIRLEQPAVIAAVITLVATRAWPRRAELRPILPMLAAFGAYVAVLTLSSALNAPKPAVSARLIIWTLLSMTAGAVTYTLLVRRRETAEERWFAATGVLHAAIGLGIAVAFLGLGPIGIPGMQTSPGEVPKVAGLAFEANLFASMLAAIAPFALERFRNRPGWATAGAVLLIVVGAGLGVTRGAYLGLGAGLIVYFGSLMYRSRWGQEFVRVIPLVVVAIVLAPSVAYATLPVARPVATEAPSGSPAPTLTPGETASPAPSRTPSPTPTATPPKADTLTYRTTRIPTALGDLRKSPIIGLGAASYGQRHEMEDRPGMPDYIGILALVTLYESGIAGAIALAVGFALALWMLWQSTRRRDGPAPAYTAALVSLLVSYQATNALFFAINWIILGAGLAVAVRSRDAETSDR